MILGERTPIRRRGQQHEKDSVRTRNDYTNDHYHTKKGEKGDRPPTHSPPPHKTEKRASGNQPHYHRRLLLLLPLLCASFNGRCGRPVFLRFCCRRRTARPPLGSSEAAPHAGWQPRGVPRWMSVATLNDSRLGVVDVTFGGASGRTEAM